MVIECIDRAGFKVNQDLGADMDGADYIEFQSSSSGGSSYVPAATLTLIVKAHADLTNAFTMSFENAPDMDQWTEVNGSLVKYRGDTKNEAKRKYYYAEYARIISFLQSTDGPDNYFGNRRNRLRKIIMCGPTETIEPDGNPL
jgi:hypothetical protein